MDITRLAVISLLQRLDRFSDDLRCRPSPAGMYRRDSASADIGDQDRNAIRSSYAHQNSGAIRDQCVGLAYIPGALAGEENLG